MNGLKTFINAVNKTNVFMGKLMVGVTTLCCFCHHLRGGDALSFRHADQLGP